MSHVTLVVNPAKVDDVEALHEALARRLAQHGWAVPELLTTTEDDPGRDLTERAVRAGAQFLIAAGGDGTVAAVISGLAGTDVPLLVLPAGTGNLLARNLGLPTDFDDVVGALVEGHDVAIDVGEVVGGPGEGDSFAVMAGLGFDAAMVADAPSRLKSLIGWPAYLISAAAHLSDEPFACQIVVDDGEPLVTEARTVLITNASGLPGGVELAPDAGVADGVLDVVVVNPQNLVDWMRVGARLAAGSEREDERLQRVRGRRIEVRTETDQVCQLDGDPVGAATCFVVEVRPRALTLRVPAGFALTTGP